MKEKPLCLKIHADIKEYILSQVESHFRMLVINKMSEDNDGLLQYTYVVRGASI